MSSDGPVAGFLFELSSRGGRGALSRVDGAARDLQGHFIGPVAVLFDENHPGVGGHGDDVDPVGTIEAEELVFAARHG